jgi:uncharacterized protein (DUF1778 family)
MSLVDWLVLLYAINEYKEEAAMPRVAVQDSQRMNLRVKPDQKARLLRAASLRNTDLTDFVLRLALREADAVIDEAERVELSSRDYSRVMDLLENPPAPNDRLKAAAAALPRSV